MKLQGKLTLVFSFIIIAAVILMNVVMSALTDKMSEDTILTNMSFFKSNANVVVKQRMLLSGQNIAPEGFVSFVDDIGEEVSEVTAKNIAIYDTDGYRMYISIGMFEDPKAMDLQNAINGKESSSIVNQNDRVLVYYSYIMSFSGKQICIMRVCQDYTSIFNYSRDMYTAVLITTIVVLSVAFIMLLVFIKNTVNPIKKLTKAINKLRENPHSENPADITGKDEIGELASAYDSMAKTIRAQLQKIEQDRDKLQKLLKYRKDFYDNMTHELKTPLTVITGYTDLLKDGADEAMLSEGLECISQQALTLRNLVSHVLESSKQMHGIEDEFEDVNLTDMLGGLCKTMGIKANRYAISINYKKEGDIHVFASKEKMRQLFVNLIDNAIKYGKKRIDVSTKVIKNTVKIEFINYVEKIDEQKIEHLFEPFYMGEEQKEKGSVGLGLSICQNIVKSHGGSIKASVLGKRQICFSVTLPCKKGL